MSLIDSPPNLLPPEGPLATPRHQIVRRVLRSFRAVIIIAAVVFIVLAWTTRSSDPNPIVALRRSATVRTVLSLLRSPSGALTGERADRVNVLLLGMGGAGHDGPLLTDTILLASIRPSTGQAALISIPRDLLIPLPDGTAQKANAINAYGERSPGTGADALRNALARVLDIEVPYYVRIDFSGFVGLIDELGGVKIDVERTIDDPRYPVPGMEEAEPYEARFTRLIIPAGTQLFDGAQALRYVRSRHAAGIEGSDFARARRQQRLILALRDRILSSATLTNPQRLLALSAAWRDHISTNLDPPEILRIAKIAEQTDGSTTVTHLVLDDGPDGELTAAIRDGAYILEPRDGSFARIQEVVHLALTGTAVTPSNPPPPELRVTVWNGTTTAGLAAQTAEMIERTGITVTTIQNAPSRDVKKTMIYRRPNINEALISKLQTILDADVSTAFPMMPELAAQPPDILIILGTSSVARLQSKNES
ncbi:MAG: LCP family protein [Candidatus Uhrbacteria bacterium]